MGTKSRLNVLKNEVVTHFFRKHSGPRLYSCTDVPSWRPSQWFFLGSRPSNREISQGISAVEWKVLEKNMVTIWSSCFEAVNQYPSDLFPERLTKPPQLKTEFFNGEETPVEFLKRIKPYTDPNSRYNLSGYCLSPGDLFYLDEFHIRC